MVRPRRALIRDLVGDGVYAEEPHFQVFEDLDEPATERQVLLVLGGSWTIMSAALFRQQVAHVLSQLNGGPD